MNIIKSRTKALGIAHWQGPAILLLGIIALLLSGCGASPSSLAQDFSPISQAPKTVAQKPADFQPEPIAYGEISGPAQELAMEVARTLRTSPDEDRVAVTTFVDVNNFDRTSAFGRAMTDALIALLHRQGFEVVELRKTNNFLIERGKGEFYLSRNISYLAAQHHVSAVLVGTYAVGMNMVLVSSRLISATNGQVLSTGLLELPKSPNLSFMLGGAPGQVGNYEKAARLRRAPGIPAATVPVMERKSKGPSKVKR